jgi:hypothetical protein
MFGCGRNRIPQRASTTPGRARCGSTRRIATMSGRADFDARVVGVFEGFLDERVDVGNVVLRVRHGGSGDPPVLLLHGPRTSTTWHRVAPQLLTAGYTVVCPDLRGYGESQGRRRPPTICVSQLGPDQGTARLTWALVCGAGDRDRTGMASLEGCAHCVVRGLGLRSGRVTVTRY